MKHERREAAKLAIGAAALVLAVALPAHGFANSVNPANAVSSVSRAPLVPTRGVLFGAFTHYDHRETVPNTMRAFERLVGRKMDAQIHYHCMKCHANTPDVRRDIASRRIPQLSYITPRDRSMRDARSLDAILAGQWDYYIDRYAAEVASLRARVFIRPMYEMNGFWAFYNVTRSGSTRKYVAAWKYLRKRFAAAGASNAVWVWSPNATDSPATSSNDHSRYYPGDAVVDWVGIDGYNWGTTRAWSRWETFSSIFQRVYSAYASRKPIMIAESASTEHGGGKGKWIHDARRQTKLRFPAVKAWFWFHANKETDWRVNSSRAALNAYRDWGADPYFHGRPGPTSRR